MTEFRDKAWPAGLGDPATDEVLTLRVHPDDHPFDPEARRAIKSSDSWLAPWYGITGPAGVVLEDYAHDEVATWPLTNFVVAGAAMAADAPHRRFTVGDGAVTCSCGVSFAPVANRTEAGEWWLEHRKADRRAEWGDLDVRAFKGSAS